MRSPFKFLDAYNAEDKNIFFGREKEVEALYNMVYKTPLVMVYGLSGTGKTSLVQAGLASRFEGPDWLPFLLRKNENINHTLRAALKAKLPEEDHTDDLNKLVERIFYQYFRPVYLLFDQFEELFILGSKEEQDQFMEDIRRLQEAEMPCRVVLILREEYIGQLYEFEKVIPTLFDYKLRVEPMSNKYIREVITDSCAAFNISLEAPKEDRLSEMINNLSSGKTNIPLTYLQVYLDMLYREDYKRTYPSGTEVTLPPLEFTQEEIASFGAIDDVLARFLREKTKEIQDYINSLPAKDGHRSSIDSNSTRPSVKEVLDAFVTEEGTKRPVYYTQEDQTISLEKSVREQLNSISDEALSYILLQLQEARLLRFRDDTIEIAHDTLAALIDEQRTDVQRALNEMRREIRSSFSVHQQTNDYLSLGQLELYEPQLKKLGLEEAHAKFLMDSKAHHLAEAKRKEKELEDEKKLRAQAEDSEKRSKKLSRFFTLASLAAFILFLISLFFLIRSETAKKDAQIAREETEDALFQAEKMIDAFYFHEDRFALAYKEDSDGKRYFYFIDKNGNSVDKLGYREWTKANQFDFRGYAKVENDSDTYLIDTMGNRYIFATSMISANESTQALDLTKQDLKRIPKRLFSDAPNLEILFLYGNQLEKLPEEILQLNRLKVLDLRNNQIKKLPERIGKLDQLNHLFLGGNEIQELPESIGQLTQLHRLDLNSNDLRRLPATISNLKLLKGFALNSNPLYRLPDQFGELQSLSTLSLNHCFIEALSENFSQLQQLKNLYLEGNFLKEWPSTLKDLHHLKVLNLSDNKLERIPETINSFTSLVSLNLEENKLKNLPEEVTELKHLQIINLQRNQITQLPQGITNWTSLKVLALGGNQITELPSVIGELNSLVELNLWGNGFSEVPRSFGQLKHLEILFLSGNELTRIPKDLGSCKSLKELTLIQNKITHLPSSISNWEKLNYISLKNNPIGPTSKTEIRNWLPHAQVFFE